jgi:hypothetical protein
MTNPSNTPPGWYEGGVAGEQRWWDGAAWTAHARPTPAAAPAPGTVPNRFWNGSKEGSLTAAILLGCFAVVAFFGTLLGMLAGPIGALPPGIAFLGSATLSVVFFLNWNGLKRNEQIVRSQQSGQPDTVPTPPHE